VSWPIYSERFMSVGTEGWHYFYVPTGMRAVIKSVDVANRELGTGGVQLYVGGPLAVWLDVQASTRSVHQELQLPVYGGESIDVYMGGSGFSAHVAGYLFNDASGRMGPPAGADVLPAPPARPDPIPWP
jgi:hypothetical protein